MIGNNDGQPDDDYPENGASETAVNINMLA